MTLLLFFMMLSLTVWLGGLIFFAFVVAPALFSILPSTHLAGLVVTRALTVLHWMGIVSGVVYIFSSIAYSRLTTGSAHPFALRHVLVSVMLILTCISQFAISPRMHALRTSVGEIGSVPPDNPVRVQFNALHVWSTRLEMAVFFMALIVLYLTARSIAGNSAGRPRFSSVASQSARTIPTANTKT